MNEKVKQAFKFLCEQYVKDLNRYENKEIDKDYFYNPKYECGFKINGENVYFADILKAFDNMEELIKGKDEYIAKLCNDRAELKEQLKQVEDFKYHYDRYKKELANNIKTINCMQEEATTNYNLIDQLEDRNDRLVERLEKQKSQITCLKIENANLLGEPFIPNDSKPKAMELYRLNETDIIDLVKFARTISKDIVISHNTTMSDDITFGCNFYNEILHKAEFDLIKKVVEKYGKKED